jgi:hypothetical protein
LFLSLSSSTYQPPPECLKLITTALADSFIPLTLIKLLFVHQPDEDH